MVFWTNPTPCPPLMVSQVQDPTTWTALTGSISFSETAIDYDTNYDFWFPLLPRDERATLGVENAYIEKVHIGLNIFANNMPSDSELILSNVPSLYLDPVMSTTHPGISKANLGYKQSNNYFRKMIEEL